MINDEESASKNRDNLAVATPSASENVVQAKDYDIHPEFCSCTDKDGIHPSHVMSASFGESVLPAKWWLHQNFLEFCYTTSMSQRFADIDAAEAKSRGVGGIALYCAFNSSPRHSDFLGCNPYDWYEPYPLSGTVQDLKDLGQRLHANRLAFGTYMTHIYVDPKNSVYQKALDPTTDNHEHYRNIFRWNANGDPVPHPFWGFISVNFGSQNAIEEIKKLQRFYVQDVEMDFMQYDNGQGYFQFNDPDNPESSLPIGWGTYKEICLDYPNRFRDVLTCDEGALVGKSYKYVYTSDVMMLA